MSDKPRYVDITNVTFCYTRIAEPYKDKFKGPDESPVYSTDIVVSEEQYDSFVELFPKKRSNPIPTAQFKEKYKIDPPYPDQKKQYVLKLKQKAFKKDGTPMPDYLRPHAYLSVNGTVQDITSTLIGNGSKGVLRYSIQYADDKNKLPCNVASLYSILVTDLVHYERKDPNDFSNYVS